MKHPIHLGGPPQIHTCPCNDFLYPLPPIIQGILPLPLPCCDYLPLSDFNSPCKQLNRIQFKKARLVSARTPFATIEVIAAPPDV